MKELIQLDDDKIIKKVPLSKELYTLGRDIDNDIVFDTAKVSRVHAFLIKDGNTYTVIDQDSRNHVWVNGQQVSRQQLVSGDRISLSQDISLLYISDGETDAHFEYALNRIRAIAGKRDLLELKEAVHGTASWDNLDQILSLVLDEIEASNETLRAEIEETEARYRQLVEYLPEQQSRKTLTERS